MGLRGCTEAELAFDGVRIERSDVLVLVPATYRMVDELPTVW